MKILLLYLTNPYRTQGASSNRFKGLIKGLVENGHEVTVGVVGGLLQKGEEVDSLKGQPNYEGRLKVIYLSKANHYNGIIGRLNTYFLEGFYHQVAKRRFKNLLKEEFDILWLTRPAESISLYLDCKSAVKCKTFIELNEFFDIYKESGATGNCLQKRKAIKDSKIFVEGIKSIDLFAIMTQTLYNFYQSMAKPDAKFMHLPMTVDLSRFHIEKGEVEYLKPYIAFTGTMNNQKDGVDILIKAFAKVADKYPTLHLYLAGFWHYDVPMQKKMILDFGLKERIHYLGVLKSDVIPIFVKNAEVLALSRPDSHQAQGGFPTKLGEYLATGNPVCVTKVGEISNYLVDNENAFMATPGDVYSFANALDRALSDKINALKVGAAGRKVAEENFDAAVQVKRLIEFLVANK